MFVPDCDIAWPQPLTTLEHYLRRSERQGAALVFVTEIDFDGSIDAGTFAQAVRITIAHHPLMRSIVDISGGVAVWLPSSTDQVFERRHLPQLPPAFAEPPERIDLQCMPGVRVRLTSADDGRCRITVGCHHVCADGQGMSHFLREICATYAALCRGDEPRFALERDRLGGRGNHCPPVGQAPIGAGEGLRNLWVTIRGRTARFSQFRGNPQPDGASMAAPEGNLVAEAELDSALAEQIRDYLRKQHFVLNDFSLAAALLMLASTDQPLQPLGFFTILNPVDLRTWADRRLPAANRVGFAFVRRRPSDWASPGELVESVAKQMRYVRERGVAAELIKGIGLAQRIPGCLRMIEKSRRFTATATLTCMSNLSVGRRHGLTGHADGRYLGAARLTRISAAAPLPPGVPLAITILASGKKLLVTMRGCPQHFTLPLLQRLLDGWQAGCKLICQS